jgi:hypothetical protein
MLSNNPPPPAVIVRSVRLLCLYVAAKMLLMGLKNVSDLMDGSWAKWSDRLKHDWPGTEYLPVVYTLGLFALTLGFYSFTIWKIRQRRNWVKYLLLTVFLTTLVYDLTIYDFAARVMGGFVVSSATVVRALLMVLYGFAVYLLFTKQSAAWFSSASRKQQTQSSRSISTD